MTEEGKITMNEFKTVVERFEDNQKKMGEMLGSVHSEVRVMKSELSVVKEQVGFLTVRVDSLDRKVDTLGEDVAELKEDTKYLKAQTARLHEGQTEIKNELKGKIGREEFDRLEMRVVKLENKVA